LRRGSGACGGRSPSRLILPSRRFKPLDPGCLDTATSKTDFATSTPTTVCSPIWSSLSFPRRSWHIGAWRAARRSPLHHCTYRSTHDHTGRRSQVSRGVGQTLVCMVMTQREPRRLTGLGIIPIALFVHNLEEALAIGPAMPRLEATWSRLLGRPVLLPSAQQYCSALVLVTAIAFGLLLLARLWDQASYALVVLQAVMALNVLAHVLGVVLLGGYAPGVITAALVEAPTSVAVLHRLRGAGWMSREQWRLLPLLAVLLHGPALLGLLAWARTS